MKSPLISILCITYNHEKYISKTIESWLSQKTKFLFEIIIGEDCSNDNTLSIIKGYSKSNSKIKIIKSDFNVGMQQNYIRSYNQCSGKYIAVCEGDDYWTDPYKLQKQVDFLEANPDYNVCFHDVTIFNETTQQFKEDTISQDVPQTTTLTDLAKRNFIHTPSVVFRNTIQPLPEWFTKTPVGDYPLWCLVALTGKIYKIEEEMAVYRVHDAGAMAAIKKQTLTQKIAFNDGMYPFYNYMYHQSGIKTFQKKAISCINVNRNYALQEKQYAFAKQYAKKALNHYFFQLTLSQLIGNILVLISPKLVKKIQ